MSAAPLDASILNETLNNESPDVPDPEDIENMLKFVKQYKEDQQRNESGPKVYPNGMSAWSLLPAFIIRQAHDDQFEENEKDIPSSSDLAQSLDAITARKLDYDEFLEVYADFPPSMKNLYKPATLFRKLMSESDEHGKISVAALQDVYGFKIDFLRYRSGMEQFSYFKPGYLTFEELHFYVTALIHHHSLLAEDDPLFKVAVEGFTEIIFFKSSGNDPKAVKITDILASGSITEFFDSIKEEDEKNYLSIAAVKRVYNRFKEAEFESSENALTVQHVITFFPSITPYFWDRFFENYCSDDKMYFVEFYKLSFMMDNLLEPNVVRYIFKVFDLNKDGVFSLSDYEPFYRHMMNIFDIRFGAVIEIENMFISLVDMTQAQEEITVKDLLVSQKFDKFFAMICDADELAVIEELGEDVDAEAQE